MKFFNKTKLQKTTWSAIGRRGGCSSVQPITIKDESNFRKVAQPVSQKWTKTKKVLNLKWHIHAAANVWMRKWIILWHYEDTTMKNSGPTTGITVITELLLLSKPPDYRATSLILLTVLIYLSFKPVYLPWHEQARHC